MRKRLYAEPKLCLGKAEFWGISGQMRQYRRQVPGTRVMRILQGERA
jgi:hypothetical protein